MKAKEILLSENLVSVVMPAFNSEQYIGEAIESVIRQSYTNWELIVVDDFSADRTPEIVDYYLAQDRRIKFVRLEKNYGASKARNTAMDLASGKYIAFLDSDDIWLPEKLAAQISFMKREHVLFSCTSYRKVNRNGEDSGQVVRAREKLDYEGILKRCPGNSTVVYNAESLGKFTVPDIRKRNDYALWLQVIKKAKFLYGLDEPLASYRVRYNSLSSRKIPLVEYQWKVFRSIEKLPLAKSCYLILFLITRKLYYTARNLCRGTRP